MQKYVHFLHKFAATHAEDTDQLKGYLVSGDVAAAENIIHTIKGVAGSLGLIDIARNTKEIDRLLRQDNKADQAHRCLDRHMAILAEYRDFQLRRCHADDRNTAQTSAVMKQSLHRITDS